MVDRISQFYLVCTTDILRTYCYRGRLHHLLGCARARATYTLTHSHAPLTVSTTTTTTTTATTTTTLTSKLIMSRCSVPSVVLAAAIVFLSVYVWCGVVETGPSHSDDSTHVYCFWCTRWGGGWLWFAGERSSFRVWLLPAADIKERKRLLCRLLPHLREHFNTRII